MRKNPSILLAIISILVASSCFPAPAECRNQGEKLQKLIQAKMRNEVDTSPFKVVEYEKIVTKMKGDVPLATSRAEREADLIDRLPGQPDVSFKQYGGYITVEPNTERQMYYYFVEAQLPNKDELPLVLWLNGGPGCSSLGYGAMTEIGPFRVGSDAKTLHINKYAWNKVANVLFLETPAGVGFSYSNDIEYYSGDSYAAQDNFVFLHNWLLRFPEYKGREFYITGESYAGHYAPQLAHNIIMEKIETHNKAINIKGIMLGNPSLIDETDNKGVYDYFEGHGLATQEAVAAVKKNCNFAPDSRNQTPECLAAIKEADGTGLQVYAYNIYGEACPAYHGPTQKPNHFSITDYDDCSPNYVVDYLNREDVQKALHANTTNLPYPWSGCTDRIHYDQTTTSVAVEMEFLFANNLTIWIYSGDTDARVPFTSTQSSLKSIMNFTVDTKYHPWYIGGEVGGYTETYKEGLAYATVRGAGHEVPSYQPLRALALFMHFIADRPLPNSGRQFPH